MAASTSCSTKWPPKLESDSAYETWKSDIGIWCELTEIAKSKRALAIHLSLEGRARAASSEIPVADLNKENGVDTLLGKLDGLFMLDKGRRQFTVFNNLYTFRRLQDSTASISDFVGEFEHVYFRFTQESMTLPDAVLAFMLLASCNLSDNQVQLVMSAISMRI